MNETAKALEALDRIFNNCEEIDWHLPEEEREGYKMLVDIEIIREALVNQKTGHWKKISPAGIMECSVCGGNVLTSDIEAYKYCHHCGAKMEGDK